jgi:hypothetical protein
VAATDTNALYHWHMGSGREGITRSGSSGSFSYGTRAGREAMPVNYVSFYDALRFANWLHNGQPMGPQGNVTTEDGAYTITALGIANNSITRNAGATIFLPSEDEWYKADYYDADSTSYFDYPAWTDTQTVCAAPRATANTANCNRVVNYPTEVGSYTGSASPNGTFDQSGNVMEWNEAIISGSSRGNRSGGWTFNPFSLRAAFGNRTNPTFELHDFGFRVASIPDQTDPEIFVSPKTLDFGDVDLGESSAGIVTISNVGEADLTIGDISLLPGSGIEFLVSDSLPTPVVVLPDGSVDVTVSFAPAGEALAEATLGIGSDDPDDPWSKLRSWGAVSLSTPS